MSTLQIEDLVIYKENAKPGQPKDLVLIVKGLSTVFESGKLNAIMGPNGCGKTTMLSSLYGLTDKKTKTSGNILLNGEKRDPKSWYSNVSLVEQLSYIPENETVAQALIFSLELKNARCKTNDRLKNYADVVENLHLSKLLGVKISALSGGEKQRVMIAIELIADKDIIILDEPTSDLDSHLALKLICYLKNLAAMKSKMIILTIHQPSEQIVRQFDNILFMVNGCAVYSGPFSQLDKFLQSNGIVKPADWTTSDFLFEAFYNNSTFKAISDQKANISAFLEKTFAKSDEVVGSSIVSNKSSKFVNWTLDISQISVLLKRSLRQVFSRKAFYYRMVFCFMLLFLAPFLQRKTFQDPSQSGAFEVITETLTAGYNGQNVPAISDAIKASSTDATIFRALSHILTFLQNNHMSIIAFGCNLISIVMTSDVFALIALDEKEMLLGHFKPISYIISALVTEYVVYVCSGVLTCIGLLAMGVGSRLYMVTFLRLILSHVLISLTIILVSVLGFASGLSLMIREMIKSIILYATILFHTVFASLIETVKNINGLLALPLRVLFALLDFMFPSILAFTYMNQTILSKFSKESEEILKDISDDTAKAALGNTFELFQGTLSMFANSTSGIFPEKIGILPILIASVVVVPLATFAIFTYKFAPRVSLNP